MNIPQDPQSGSFIVNLCALPRPSLPEHMPIELEGLRPFLSRRTRDGIHRFYLHVGFFHSRTEAETWLRGARAAYPNAFVSELEDTLRPAEPGAPPFADTQVITELEVRAPRHDDESSDSGSYAVGTKAKAEPPKPPKTTDVWSEVVAEVNNDSSGTSGVRHLRVEIQRPRNRPGKSSKTRR